MFDPRSWMLSGRPRRLRRLRRRLSNSGGTLIRMYHRCDLRLALPPIDHAGQREEVVGPLPRIPHIEVRAYEVPRDPARHQAEVLAGDVLAAPCCGWTIQLFSGSSGPGSARRCRSPWRNALSRLDERVYCGGRPAVRGVAGVFCELLQVGHGAFSILCSPAVPQGRPDRGENIHGRAPCPCLRDMPMRQEMPRLAGRGSMGVAAPVFIVYAPVASTSSKIFSPTMRIAHSLLTTLRENAPSGVSP